jgi:hypothetical protein
VLVLGRLGFILLRVEESRNRNDDGAQDDAEYLPISGGSKCRAIKLTRYPLRIMIMCRTVIRGPVNVESETKVHVAAIRGAAT